MRKIWLGMMHIISQARSLDSRQKLIALASVTIIAGSMLYIFLSGRRPPNTTNTTLFAGVGQVVGEQITKLLASRGRIVIVTVETQKFPNPGLDAELDQLLKTLKPTGITVAATESLPIEQLTIIGPYPPFAAQQFLAIMQRYRAVDAVVSLTGMPLLSDEEIRALPSPHPKVIVVSPVRLELESLLEQQVVHIAIMPRAGVSNASIKPTRPSEWFDRYYQVVTSEASGKSANQ